jgi:hypothetical protein
MAKYSKMTSAATRFGRPAAVVGQQPYPNKKMIAGEYDLTALDRTLAGERYAGLFVRSRSTI